MSRVTFVPQPGTEYESGWPMQVIGDGFIGLRFVDAYSGDGVDTAVYRDNFREEYEFFDKTAGEWDVEVREDG